MSGSDWSEEFEAEDGGPPRRAPRPARAARESRRRSALVPTVVILLALAVFATVFADVWTDLLWFRSVGFAKVFTTTMTTRIVLFLAGFLLAGALVAASLVLAYRSRPFYVPTDDANETLEQYREAIEPVRRYLTIGVPLLVGGLAGAALAAQWRTYLAWRNSVPFGTTDLHFGKDIGFFVFTLPWISVILSFLTMVLIATILAGGFTHYVYAGLRLPGRGPSTRAALIHLGVLGAALALVRAGSFWFGRYSLSVGQSKLMTGIGYTDAHAVLPTRAILAFAAVVCAVLFLSVIVTHSWRLPIIGVALIAVLTVVVGTIYPAIVQSVKVNPSQRSLEAPYLQRSIEATRAAYGLDTAEVQPYLAKTDATPGQLRDDAATIPGIRLVDPIVVPPAFKQDQGLRDYYAFPDALDVDRYTIGGKETDVIVAAREISLDGVPAGQRNWLNDHTFYTHGFGLVAAKGNTRGPDGRPDFAVMNIPPTDTLGPFEPRIYFGEKSPLYSVVGAKSGEAPRELDYPDSKREEVKNTYAGAGGVPIGSFLRQAAYAVKYREVNFLLSDAVGSASRILDHRTPLDRVQRVAPWLTLDGNPYPSIVNGRVVWIVDGYTTSANYPYSQMENLDTATSDSTTARVASVAALRSGQINYVRNSVKATVDAYDGTVRLYAWDEADPVLRTWMKAYPGTVLPTSAIPGALMAHLRYPEDLFKIQRLVLSRYHVTRAEALYAGNDNWRVPSDPAQEDRDVFQPPYYLTLAMPGQDAPSFSLTTTFMPAGDTQVLSGFLAVDANAGKTDGVKAQGYGKLRLLELSRGSNVKGPGQVQNDINSSNANSTGFSLTLSQFLNNARQQGSRVSLGNLLTLPVGGGLLYVQPIYVSANSASALPLNRVTVAAFGNKLAWSDTLSGALDQLFGGNAGASAGDSGGTPPTTPQTPTEGDAAALNQALADLKKAFADGQEALKAGDFAKYGEAQKAAQDALARAIAAAPKGGSATPTN